MAISDEKYVLLTTFRKSGEAVTTPVWIAPLADGDLIWHMLKMGCKGLAEVCGLNQGHSVAFRAAACRCDAVQPL